MRSIARCTLLLPLATGWRTSASPDPYPPEPHSNAVRGNPGAGAITPESDAASVPRALAPGNLAVVFGRTIRSMVPADEHGQISGGERLFALVLHPNGELARVDLGPIEPIIVAVARWRDAIGEPLRRGAFHPEAEDGVALARGEELRRLVLDPVLAAAGDVRTLSICPDGPLHLVNLDALPFDSTGTLVGECVTIACITSLADLLLPHAQGAEDPTLLTFSPIEFGPVQGGTPLPSTPSDRLEEVHAVEDAFNGAFHGREELVSGLRATKAAFSDRSRNASYVHVVTEARPAARSQRELEPFAAVPATQDPSSLEFSSASPGSDPHGGVEGILTVEELGGLDLSRCEIAVLSASETHVGVMHPGEGVRSLCVAAHRAGARTVLGSLWEIDEAATAELMSRFYSRLWIDRQSPAQALWGAKMDLRSAGRPLREWAGWVLVGAPD